MDRLLSTIDGFEQYRLHVSAPQWSADSQAVWLTAPDPITGERYAWKVEVSNRRAVRVAPAEQVKPAPDGRVALARADGTLWLANENGSTIRRIATLAPVTLRSGKQAMPQVLWSPDSRQLAYLVPPRPAPDAKGSSHPAEIHVLDANSGQRRTAYVAPSETESIESLSWMPDGHRIVFAVEQPSQYTAEIRLLDLNPAPGSEAVRVLVKDSTRYAIYLNPSPSPDGAAIAFALDPLRWITVQSVHAATVDTTSGAIKTLTGNDRWINFLSGFQWTPDSSAFYATCKGGAFNSRLCRIGRDGSVRTIPLEPLQSIAHTYDQGEKWAISPDAEKVAWISADAQGRMTLRHANLDGSGDSELMDLSPPMLRGFRVGAVKELTWRSFDGLQIAGIVVLPVGYDPGRRYPLIVDLHGGPQGGVPLAGSLLLSSPMEWHLWTNMDYAVLVADYRSSNVYGVDKFLALRHSHELFNQDFRDVNAGVDALIAEGIADPLRLALMGHSYGAALSNWILTQTDRFRLVIPKEGALAVDLARTYRFIRSVSGEEGALFTQMYDWLFGGPPDQVPENYARQSAVTYVARARSPVMVIAGGDADGRGDERGSPGQTWADALRPYAAEVSYLEYPNEGHVFTKPETHRDLLKQVTAQLRRHFAADRSSEK